MRKAGIAAGLGAVALCAVAFATLAAPHRDVAPPTAAGNGPSVASHRATPRGPQDSDSLAQVDALVADDDVAAGHKLSALYTLWAGQDDKRAAREHIITSLLADTDRKRGLRRVLEVVGRDETAIDDDPLLGFAIERFAQAWQDPTLFRYGRDLLLVQPTDKTRVLLGDSLAAHVAQLDDLTDPDAQTRTLVAGDMVDAYFGAGEAGKGRLLAAARQVGGKDVARALAEPDREIDRFETTREGAIAAHSAIQEMHGELGDTEDPDLQGFMPALSGLAELEPRELLAKLVGQ
jgi:hypothetical protein